MYYSTSGLNYHVKVFCFSTIDSLNNYTTKKWVSLSCMCKNQKEKDLNLDAPHNNGLQMFVSSRLVGFVVIKRYKHLFNYITNIHPSNYMLLNCFMLGMSKERKCNTRVVVHDTREYSITWINL